MPLREITITTPDGTSLFVRHFVPNPSAAHRTLVVLHGASEYGGRYEHLAVAGAERGWNVVIPDLRGHGRSSGIPVHVRAFAQYLDDLDRIFAHLELDPAGAALLGHSMGGLVAIRFAETRPHRIAALVAVAPLLGIAAPVPRWKLHSGRVMSHIAPRTRFLMNLDPRDLTHDADCLRRRAEDPLMHWTVTARWYVEVERTIPAAHAAAAALEIPTLLVQGDADRIVSPAAARLWFDAIGSRDKTMISLPDHLHELLHEPDKAETVQTIFDWLDPRVPHPS